MRGQPDTRRVLSVASEPTQAEATEQSLSDVDVTVVSTVESAIEALVDDHFDAVVCVAAGDRSWTLGTIEAIRSADASIPILLTTSDPDGRLASEATRRGATDYVVSSENLGDRIHETIDTDHERPTGPNAAFDTLGDTVSDLVVTIDRESTIVYANDSAAAVTGYDREELLGESLTTIMPERFVAAHEAAFRTYLETGERTRNWDNIELTIQHADGHELPVSISFGEFTDDDDRYFTGVVRDISEQKARQEELEESQRSLQALYDIASRPDQSFEDKLDEMLALGCERLSLPYGYLTQVDGESIRIEQSQDLERYEGVETPLDATYCRETVGAESLVTIPDTTAGKWGDSKPTEVFDMQCYVGGRVDVDDQLYGTLCFTDTEPRSEGFTDAQETFVELIVQWLSYELERRRHEALLTSLLDRTRSLMRASTPEAVASEVVEAAMEVLGFELNIVRVYDPEQDCLRPTAMTDETKALLGDRPIYEPGEGVPGTVYERGESTIYTVTTDTDDGERIETDALCLPLGDYGTLTLSTRSKEGFDSTDRQVAQLLATNAETALERARRDAELTRYETVVETVQHMVFVVDGEGRCTLVTAPLAERLGVDRAEIEDHDLRSIVAESDRTVLDTALSALQGDRGMATVDVEIQTTGGAFPATIDLSALPGERFDGAVGVVHDRTELTEAKAELADERDRFSDLFENLPDAIVEVELQRGEPRIVATNAAFEDVFGWQESSVVGASLTDLIVPEEERASGEQLAQRAATGEIIQQEVRRKTADGAGYFLFRGVPYDVGPDGTRAFGIYTDITEQRIRQRQLQVLNRVFRHNLRNDLTVVLGVINHLLEQVQKPAEREMLETLHSKAEGLSGMSETVRTIERTVSRGTVADEVDATAIIETVAEEFRQTAPDAEITIETPPSVRVAADDHLRIALEQLFENAIKHNDSATPAVHCELSTAEEGEWTTISVLDDGPGIPEHERVVAADQEIDQLNHASGLGLWLVRWIVDSYGGRLAFDDRPEGGSAVRLSLRTVE